MKLSPREQQVLTLLSTGRGYKAIADYLGMSLNTVRTRVRTLYLKLDAHSVDEAVENYELFRHGKLQVRL